MLPLIDSWTYHDLAAGLAERGVFDEKFLWQAIFYPAFLASVYAVFGVSVGAAVLVQVFVAGVTCFLTHRLGFRLFGRGPALAAGFIYSIYGPLVFFETRLLATGWTAFFTVTIALVLVGVDRAPSWRKSLGLGLFGALAILTRPTFLPVMIVLPVLVAFLEVRRRESWLSGARVLGPALAGLVLVLGPVGWGLAAKTGHTGIIPPSGGVNLFIGNNADYEQTINVRPGLRWDRLMSEPSRHGYDPDPWSGQPYFMDQVMAFGRETPGSLLALWGTKTTQLGSSRELPRNQDVYLHRQWSGVLSLLVFKAGPWGFPWGMVFPLAGLGLVVGWRRIPVSILVLLAMSGAALVMVFVSSRYRSPLVPLMAVLAGQGLMWGIRTVRNRDRGLVVKASGLLVVCLVLTTVPGPFAQESVDLEGEFYFAVGHHYYRREDWPAAAEHLRKSVALDSRTAAPRNFLGITLARMGDWSAACAQFDTALIIDPNYGEARRNLARCRRGLDRN
jgi:4-amino-4-deoxy-L-arabinose transferase-like glycosyltransferase